MRTNTDFSKHVLTETKREDLLVHTLAKSGTTMDSLTFINTNDIMAVTGNYGNWIFCREFHPSGSGKVSDTYWIEKLQLASSQDPYDFDGKKAKEEIEELLQDPDKSLTDKEKEWLNELSEATDGSEFEYIAVAMNYPSSFLSEMIPKGKITKYWLLVVFDAFEEICHIIKEQPDRMVKSKKTFVKDKSWFAMKEKEQKEFIAIYPDFYKALREEATKIGIEIDEMFYEIMEQDDDGVDVQYYPYEGDMTLYASLDKRKKTIHFEYKGNGNN